MNISDVARVCALPHSTMKARHAITTIVQFVQDSGLEVGCLPNWSENAVADNLSGQDGQANSEGFAIHTGNKDGEGGTMAILIVLQNPGLASEIGICLRRDGRVVKSFVSVAAPEFLK